MCNHCTTPDPRDAVYVAAKAVRALHALMQDRAHPCYGDAELPTLLEFIDEKLFPAAEALLDYVPRGHAQQVD
jgi:hypothetical protein